MIELESRIYSSLENRRVQALSGLESYLQTPEEKILHKYQKDVMQSYHDFLLNGGTAGYIDLPPGSGKTIFASELAKATRLKTVFLSPTQPILEQTHSKFQKFAPELEISNWYAQKKEIGGQVFNTTYQSFITLLESGKIDPDEIELLICDEAHTALGELRHKIFRKIPNALMVGLTATPYFTQIEGFKKRGIVESSERWLELFEKCIHEMSLEEVIERGICPPIDVHLLRTNVTVKNIGIQAGKYNSKQMERELSMEGRNNLALAMIAGMDKLPSYIRIPPDKRAEIEEIHRKIKDKRTILFGFSVRQVKDLARRLRVLGIKAEALWGGMPKHEDILKDHIEGKTQVVLSVDLLRLGWDSPPTEVGIFMEPHFSAISAVQELGRIMRLSEDTGKEKAIAIQLVDEFIKPNQAPVLIPDIFNPYFVLRGSQTGKKPSRSERRNPQDIPKIFFFGMEINALLEETKSRFLLQRRLKQATLQEISEALDQVILEIQNRYGDLTPLNFYREVAEQLPFFTPAEKAEEALQAIASLDSNTVALGKKVLAFLYMSTILNAIEPYLSDSEDENDEIVQAGISGVIEGLSNVNKNITVGQNIFQDAKEGAAKYISEKEGVPHTWLLNGWRKGVFLALGEYSTRLPWRSSEEEIQTLAKELAETTGGSRELIYEYINFKNLRASAEDLYEKDLFEEVLQDFLEEDLDDGLRRELTPRERVVLEMTQGILYETKHTLGEVGDELGISHTRVGQIVGEALRKLRTSRSFLRRMSGYLGREEEPQWHFMLQESEKEAVHSKPEAPKESEFSAYTSEDRELVLKHFRKRPLKSDITYEDLLSGRDRGIVFDSVFDRVLDYGTRDILSKIGTVAELLSLSASELNELFSVDEWIGNKKYNLELTFRDHRNFQNFLQTLLEEAKKLEGIIT